MSKHITNSSPDLTPPSINLTAPSSGNILAGSVNISASDNVGVAGVQFHLDSAYLGVEDTTNAYTLPWDTTTVPDGTYTLTDTARITAVPNITSPSPGSTPTISSVTFQWSAGSNVVEYHLGVRTSQATIPRVPLGKQFPQSTGTSRSTFMPDTPQMGAHS
jgi:hypothetical protein